MIISWKFPAHMNSVLWCILLYIFLFSWQFTLYKYYFSFYLRLTAICQSACQFHDQRLLLPGSNLPAHPPFLLMLHSSTCSSTEGNVLTSSSLLCSQALGSLLANIQLNLKAHFAGLSKSSSKISITFTHQQTMAAMTDTRGWTVMSTIVVILQCNKENNTQLFIAPQNVSDSYYGNYIFHCELIPALFTTDVNEKIGASKKAYI